MVKNIVAIIQARTNSIRLPNKILFKINNMMLIEILYKRLEKSKKINQIVIATTKKSKNLIHFLKKKKIKFFVGSEKNVLNRYYKTASKFKADTIVRITADGILADPKLIDRLIGIYENKNVDYLSNIEPATFPDGLDIEIFNFKILKYANFNAKTKYDKEHVTPFIRSINEKNKFNVLSKKDYSKLRLTLDEPEDFVLLQRIFNYFKPDIYFGWRKIVSLINKNKKYQVNSHIERDEGATMTRSNKLWKRAKKIIPGGNMLLSKRPELFHPKNWPAYYSKAKGIDVWDLDGKKYRDLSLMGIGCNILGYFTCREKILF